MVSWDARSFAVANEPLQIQFEGFLDEYRAALRGCLDGLTEQQARRRMVSSATTLLGLVKHVTFVEWVWFGEAVTGRPRTEYGMPPTSAETFVLTDADSITSVQEAHDAACAASRAVAAELGLDDVVRGHRMGPVPVRWIYLHVLRELTQHCGHTEILREQVLAANDDG